MTNKFAKQEAIQRVQTKTEASFTTEQSRSQEINNRNLLKSTLKPGTFKGTTQTEVWKEGCNSTLNFYYLLSDLLLCWTCLNVIKNYRSQIYTRLCLKDKNPLKILKIKITSRTYNSTMITIFIMHLMCGGFIYLQTYYIENNNLVNNFIIIIYITKKARYHFRREVEAKIRYCSCILSQILYNRGIKIIKEDQTQIILFNKLSMAMNISKLPLMSSSIKTRWVGCWLGDCPWHELNYKKAQL